MARRSASTAASSPAGTPARRLSSRWSRMASSSTGGVKVPGTGDAKRVVSRPVELAGRVAVVTGGASGIGRAMVRRFAAEGARGVVAADLNEDGARAVAEELGENALGVGCDVSDDAQVGELIERANEAFGPIDLFCANAGIATGAGLDAPDELWDRTIDINVKAHVYA